MNQRRGTLLVVVLVIVMMISLAAYHFTASMELENLATSHAGDQIAARHCALSGIDWVASILQQPRHHRQPLSMIAADPIDLWPSESKETSGLNAAGPQSPYQVRVVLPGRVRNERAVRGPNQLAPTGKTEMPANTIDAARLQQVGQRVYDESSKLDLRQLLLWDQSHPGTAHQALLRLPDMDDQTADRLLDWIDTDSEPRVHGDEQGARNSLPITVDELANLATGESDQSLGDQRSASTGARRPAWIPYLTIHSAERNESFDGRQRIFVNEPDLIKLHRAIEVALSKPIADYVVLLRQHGPTADEQGMRVSSAELSIDFLLPPRFEITGLEQLVGTAIKVPAADDAAADESSSPDSLILASPISLQPTDQSKLTADGVLDRLTISEQPRLQGRINILTAPAEVLAAIPGLDQQTAERIVNGRNDGSQRFRHPIGLLSSLSIDLTIVKQILPHLTMSGDVVRFESVGTVHANAGPVAIGESVQATPTTYRCDVMLDASYGRARQIWFRHLQTPVRQTDADVQPTRTPPRSQQTGWSPGIVIGPCLWIDSMLSPWNRLP